MGTLADAEALETKATKDKQALVDQLDRARRRMTEVIDKIDKQREVYPHWTLKHFLAHLTGWDDALVVSLRAYAAGKEPGTPAYRGIDSYNEQTVAERETLDYDQIVAEWNATRQQLRNVILSLPPAKVYDHLVYPWGHQGSLRFLIKIMADHELEHAEELERLIAPAARPPSPDAPDQPT